MTYRVIIVWFSLFIINTIFSQESNYKISPIDNGFKVNFKIIDQPFTEWTENGFTIRKYNGFINESKPGNFILPSQIVTIAIPQNSNPEIKIIDLKKKLLDRVIPATNPNIILSNDSSVIYKESEIKLQNKVEPIITDKNFFWLRDFYCMSFRINTHSFNTSLNTLELIEELEIDISLGESILKIDPIVVKSDFDETLKSQFINSNFAEQFRSKDAKLKKENKSWIDYDAPYLKLSVVEDGIYRVSKNDFNDLGQNKFGIDPQTIQIFKNGIEIPITVNVALDNTFDDGDYIEFYGTKNYNDISARVINNDTEPYNEFLNRYTDTSYYFITWNVADGKRIPISTEDVASTDTLDFHYNFKHYEENPRDALYYTFHSSLVESQLPFWNTGKSWYWNWLANWRSQLSIPFNVINYYENSEVYFYTKIMSFGSDVTEKTHYYSLEFNGNVLDTSLADKFKITLLEGIASSNDLSNGSNNLIIKYQNRNGSTTGSSVLDWVEVEYPQYIQLDSSSIEINFLHNLEKGYKTIKVGNISEEKDYLIYRAKPTVKKIENYLTSNSNLYFKDTVESGNKYIVVDADFTLKPKMVSKSFKNLLKELKQVDYVAITHPEFSEATQNYVQMIEGAYDLSTEVISVNDIYDEFGFGYPTAESIKDFIKVKLKTSPSPFPSYFTFIGDANYDYKGYRQKYADVKGGQNFIPSYGFPVSDTWYVISEDLSLPEAYIGRIPVNTNEQLIRYTEKVQNYISLDYSSWNKRSMFFSGGDGNDQNQLNILKNANDRVINDVVSIPPLNSVYTHFYKSVEGDFGPYSDELIKTTIDEGALFISYVGHSGTSTWDNSISDVLQLKNKYGYSPLISDFGCSTNKFAEPDIVSFGERFLLEEDGDAIGYIGNSALGFTSIATSAPLEFYSSLVSNTNKSIGSIHYYSKLGLYNLFGNSSIFNVYNYTNTLIGDPAIRIKIPEYPNLSIGAEDFLIENVNKLSSESDSIMVLVKIRNEGLTTDNELVINLKHSFQNRTLLDSNFTISVPPIEDTLSLFLNIYGSSGDHQLMVNIDPNNSIEEIKENDNLVDFHFYVFSNKLKDLVLNDNENPKLNNISILSPSTVLPNSKIILEKSSNSVLNNSTITDYDIDSVYTRVAFDDEGWERTWFRYGLESIDTIWSPIKSFGNTYAANYFLGDSIIFTQQKLENLIFDTALVITDKEISLGVVSAGASAGANCIITKNGKNILENSFFSGIGVAVIEPNGFLVDTTHSFDLWNKPESVRELTKFLYSISDQKIVIMGVSNDGMNNMTDSLKNAIKLFGSKLIDSLEFKGSWAFIGSKFMNTDSILEEVQAPYDGPASLVSNYELFNETGYLVTKSIGPVEHWDSLFCEYKNTGDSKIEVIPIGSDISGRLDTLDILNLLDGKADLSFLNNRSYEKVKFLINLYSSEDGASPQIKSIGINYKTFSELAINNQVVSVEKDTLEQGEESNLSFYVYNVGESRADSFTVIVDVINPDNSRQKIFETIVDSLGSEKRKKFNISHATSSFNGERSFAISIDSDDKVLELYEDNNFYNIPFYVKGDTTRPSLNLTIDGNDIFDGEYISNTPEIKIELSDPSLVPIEDTASVRMYLNNQYIPYFGTTENLDITYSASNPKVTVNYNPTLEDGEYTLKVFGKDASGNISDSSGITKSFNIQSDAKLLNVYNYPNPFSTETYFTFKLTQIPDEIKIKVFTVAGRLIKEIELNSSQLNFDLNKIYWDGRDEEGDLLGNGVYLYKVIMDVDGKKQDVTQKMAVVR